jgi:hypothetical protein
MRKLSWYPVTDTELETTSCYWTGRLMVNLIPVINVNTHPIHHIGPDQEQVTLHLHGPTLRFFQWAGFRLLLFTAKTSPLEFYHSEYITSVKLILIYGEDWAWF